MTTLKTDADQIRNFLINLAKQDWLKRTERRWWPQFVFHYTDIRNAVKILEEGYLYSRKYLKDNKNLEISSGSPEVLEGTETIIKDCVRLYFRPKTPTQFYAEGVLSKDALLKSKFPGAHCPVPVFFLFDAVKILTRDDCLFSNGNLGSHKYQILYSATHLEQLPWEKIYHTGPIDLSKVEDSDIVFRRNAEVVVSQKLDLNALSFIYCRSEAERETLLYLLPPNLRKRYQNKIAATTRSDLFFRRQTFIETVRLSSETVYVQFSPETESPGPFHLRIDLKTTPFYDEKNFNLKKSYKWNIPLPAASYPIHLYLDDHLVYANTYEEIELPF